MPGSTVGWVIISDTVSFTFLEFESGRFFFFPFSKFLSLVSFFRVRLSVRLRFRDSVRIRVKVRF